MRLGEKAYEMPQEVQTSPDVSSLYASLPESERTSNSDGYNQDTTTLFYRQFDELTRQLKELFQQYAVDITPIEDLTTNFKGTFFGGMGNTLCYKQIKEHLEYVVILLVERERTKPNQNESFLQDLSCNIDVCGPGIINNLQLLIGRLQESTDIAQQLKHFRDALVEEYAAQYVQNRQVHEGMEIHALPAFANYANDIKWNVLQGTTISDPHSSDIGIQAGDITNFHSFFIKRYATIAIIECVLSGYTTEMIAKINELLKPNKSFIRRPYFIALSTNHLTSFCELYSFIDRIPVLKNSLLISDERETLFFSWITLRAELMKFFLANNYLVATNAEQDELNRFCDVVISIGEKTACNAMDGSRSSITGVEIIPASRDELIEILSGLSSTNELIRDLSQHAFRCLGEEVITYEAFIYLIRTLTELDNEIAQNTAMAICEMAKSGAQDKAISIINALALMADERAQNIAARAIYEMVKSGAQDKAIRIINALIGSNNVTARNTAARVICMMAESGGELAQNALENIIKLAKSDNYTAQNTAAKAICMIPESGDQDKAIIIINELVVSDNVTARNTAALAICRMEKFKATIGIINALVAPDDVNVRNIAAKAICMMAEDGCEDKAIKIINALAESDNDSAQKIVEMAIYKMATSSLIFKAQHAAVMAICTMVKSGGELAQKASELIIWLAGHDDEEVQNTAAKAICMLPEYDPEDKARIINELAESDNVNARNTAARAICEMAERGRQDKVIRIINALAESDDVNARNTVEIAIYMMAKSEDSNAIRIAVMAICTMAESGSELAQNASGLIIWLASLDMISAQYTAAEAIYIMVARRFSVGEEFCDHNPPQDGAAIALLRKMASSEIESLCETADRAFHKLALSENRQICHEVAGQYIYDLMTSRHQNKKATNFIHDLLAKQPSSETAWQAIPLLVMSEDTNANHQAAIIINELTAFEDIPGGKERVVNVICGLMINAADNNPNNSYQAVEETLLQVFEISTNSVFEQLIGAIIDKLEDAHRKSILPFLERLLSLCFDKNNTRATRTIMSAMANLSGSGDRSFYQHNVDEINQYPNLREAIVHYSPPRSFFSFFSRPRQCQEFIDLKEALVESHNSLSCS